MFIRPFKVALVVGAALAALGGIANAQPACSALGNDPVTGNPLPPPLYISGSTALEPMLKVVGPKLAALATGGYTLVYIKDGSCSGVTRAFSDGLIKTNALYIPASYNPATTPTPPTCTIPAAGQLGDLVLSDVDPTLCPGVAAVPATQKQYLGPVNNMVFIVPSPSTQQAISMEMAYLVLGLGMNGQVTPWVDPNFYFIRTPDSGTRAMITANIGTTTHNWQGVSADPTTGKAFGSGDVISHVAGAATTAPEKTIGIVGADVYDSGNNRTTVKALAFRALHQRYAYWPDSTLTSHDRRNVRDGRYSIWGNVHMLLAVNGTTPTSVPGKFFVDLIQGTLATPPFDATDAIVDAHLVPVCAMNVQHSVEGQPMMPYKDAAPCGCYFDNRVAGTAPAGCVACSTTTPCAAGTGTCNRGFCQK
jgi:ABC-type phosphate transport system substrate-binding protein